MKEKLKHLLGISITRPVFVVGTGRSGTHWLGYSLGDHPEVRATVEVRPMFDLSTKMALDPSLEGKLFDNLVRAYRWQLLKSAPRLYLDKTHPNIWLAEKLKAAFPYALFVGIERHPYATVASMMKHSGVSAWHDRWREFPVPNRFLGITAELAARYDTVPRAAQCAIRWAAHRDRMNELRRKLRDSLLVISYETFARDTQRTIRELQFFLGLRRPIPIPEVRLESLRKWENQLSREQIGQIQEIVGFSPESMSADPQDENSVVTARRAA
jgi:hypothetical protein